MPDTVASHDMTNSHLAIRRLNFNIERCPQVKDKTENPSRKPRPTAPYNFFLVNIKIH